MLDTRDHQTDFRIDRTSAVIFGVLVFFMLVMLGRVVQLQLRPSAQLAAHMGERTSSIVEPGRRGDILDRRGRVLSATHFGSRVFVDPLKFRSPPDADILTLADAMGVGAEKIGPRIIEKMAENERRGFTPIAPREKGGKSSPEVKDKKEQDKAAIEKIKAMFTSSDTASTEEVEPADDGTDTKKPKPIRYVPLGGILEEWRAEAIKKLNIPGVHIEARNVREVTAEETVASLLGKVGSEGTGMMGEEKVLDARMQPVSGKLTYVRDAGGRPLWVPPGGYTPPQRGEDVRLSIDLQLQRIAMEELERGVVDADAAGGRLVMMDPNTGEVLAMADIVRPVHDAVEYDWKTVISKDKQWGGGPWGPRYITIRPDPARDTHPALGRNRCVEDLYEPGSTFKPFMWSATTELGLASITEVINTEGGHWTTPYGGHISDVVHKDRQTWAEVLINSSNIGMVKVTSRMDFQQMRSAVVKFGFGHPAGTGLPGESPGLVTSPKAWSKFTQTSVAMGHEVAVTPVQMARAFSVFARSDEQAGTLPPISLTAEGETPPPEFMVSKRVLPAEVALLTRKTLRGVTANLDRKLAARKIPEEGWQYELFGKSGTADMPLGLARPGKKRPKGSDGYFKGQYNSSFIAGGPVEHPRLVVVVVIDDPGPEHIKDRTHYGAAVAGPVVRRVMERSLSYLGVPPSPPPDGVLALMPHAE